jgi:putative ABC transport system permease protein
MIPALRHAVFLAVRHLIAGPGRSVVLILGSTVALFLPLFTFLAAEMIESRLLHRAQSSPILLGHKGNEFDLTMTSLYFGGHVRDPIRAGVRNEVDSRGYGLALPIYVNHSAGGMPIVGTSLEYFEARGLQVALGRRPAVLGELVAGYEVARQFNLELGDKVRSDLTNLYNIAGAYPQLLQVVGILERSGSPDDDVFFADVKTVWMLDGWFHGHQEVTPDLSLNPEAGEGENLEATAAIFMFNEINDSNRTSYHLHGDESEMPLSAVLVFPNDAKAFNQLLGDYALEQTLQAVEPEEVIRTILSIVLRVREGMSVYFGLVAFSTISFFVLALSLTLRLRRNEITLMRRIGCSRFTIQTIVGTEIILLLLCAVVLTLALTWAGLSIIETRLA